MHPSSYELEHPKAREGYNESSNSRDTVESLAVNFAENYRGRQHPQLKAQNKASYSLVFTPTYKIIEKQKEGMQHYNPVVRALTEDEQKTFIEAFTKANEEAQKTIDKNFNQ